MARAATPLMEGLAPTPELAWFAPLAVRTLYPAGQFERAGAWLTVLRLDGRSHPVSLEAYEALQPLQRLSGGAEPLTPATLAGERGLPRSEVHTSELQSLMSLLYAVFCLT